MSGLSDYAGWLYAQPGVESLLLTLQDEAGQDVLLLLTACWLGRRQVAADAQLWRSLHGCQTPWREQVIAPLRQVRRTLAGDSATGALYQQIKACELAAEWHQLGVLEQLCQRGVATNEPALDCILAHLHRCGGDPADQRLQQLATAALAAQR